MKSEETSYDTRTSSSSSVWSWRQSGNSRVSLIVYSKVQAMYKQVHSFHLILFPNGIT